MTSGLEARPRNRGEEAVILANVQNGGGTECHQQGGVSPQWAEEWESASGHFRNRGLLLYAYADGSFSVWDEVRDAWGVEGNKSKSRRPPYVFTESEVWGGLRDKTSSAPLCNGSLSDWSSWIKARDANANAMAKALRALSPDPERGDEIVPGRPVRHVPR